MAASRSIQGKSLTLEIGGVEYQPDLSNIVLDNEEADTDTVFFGDTNSRQYFFEATVRQSVATASLWRYIWENEGDEVNFTFNVEGNVTPTADSPHFTGTLVIPAPPQLGGEATLNRNAVWTADVRFDVIGKPTLDTGV